MRTILVIATLGFMPIVVAGCESPVSYRPEIDQFAKATAEAAKYLEVQRTTIDALRSDLRRRVLARARPQIGISTKCRQAILAFNEAASKAAPTPIDRSLVTDCGFDLPEDFSAKGLFDPAQPIRNSVAFGTSVSAYAAALGQIATSGDREGFVKAVNGLGDAAASLAANAAKAAGATPPDTAAVGPIANLVANAAFYYLENKRAEALKTAAVAAKPWIDSGAAAVVRVLYAVHFEQVNQANQTLLVAVDAVNEAQPNQYPDKADRAIRSLGRIRNLLGGDPGAAMRALPEAHDKLIAAFDDRKRHLDGAIAAAQNLHEAARAAQAELVNR